jgi:hypothetical protein
VLPVDGHRPHQRGEEEVKDTQICMVVVVRACDGTSEMQPVAEESDTAEEGAPVSM